ncbi:MAG: type II secretion system protein GspG [Phycisphaerales bacterium]
MSQDRRAWRGARGGFSLLELMLVLAIIGVLTAVAAWNIAGTGERAKIRVTKTSMATIREMLQSYQVDHSAYPPDLAALVAGKFMEAGRDKDGFGRGFYYRPTGVAERPYDLISAGPDGQLNTPDDINVWTMNQKP